MDETNNKEVLEVSDWSQKWKLGVYAIAIFGFAGFVYFAVLPWANEVLIVLKQIAENTTQ